MTTDLEAGIAARDSGIEQVLENNPSWYELTVSAFNKWLADKPIGYQFAPEDFRLDPILQGQLPPKHPNAWGGFACKCICRHPQVRYSGLLKQMRSPAGHARQTFVYEKIP